MLRICSRRLSTRVVNNSAHLYRKNFDLEEKYFVSLKPQFGVVLNHKVVIKERNNFVRGLYLDEKAKTVRQGEAVAVVPLDRSSTLTTKSLVATVNSADCVLGDMRTDVTEEAVRKILVDKKIFSSGVLSLVPHITLALNMALAIDLIPDPVPPVDPDYQRRLLLRQHGIAPLLRMIDDDGFAEDMVWHVYSTSLDDKQRLIYKDMLNEFNAAVQVALLGLGKLPKAVSEENIKRLTRMVLGRVEHVYTPEWQGTSPRAKMLWQALDRLRHFTPGTGLGPKNPNLGKEIAIVPLTDMLNHNNLPNCALQYGCSKALGGRYGLTIRAVKDIQPGQELYRHYNCALSLPLFLFRNGFLPFSVVMGKDLDPFVEQYVQSPLVTELPWMKEQEVDQTEAAELDRLEGLYKNARGIKQGKASESASSPSPSS